MIAMGARQLAPAAVALGRARSVGLVGSTGSGGAAASGGTAGGAALWNRTL